MKMKKKKNNKVIMSTIEQDLYLSEDLILKILSRLPPITLVRFKSVSKTWYSLISNHDFCRRHTALYQFHGRHHHIHDDDHHLLEEPSPPPGILLRRGFWDGDSNIVIYPHPSSPDGHDHQQQNHALLLQNLNDYRPALNEVLPAWSSAPPKKERFMLTDSCNGLLLYVHSCRHIECNTRTFYVCNPITKDCIKLPTIDGVDIVDIHEELFSETKIAQIVFNPSFSLTYKVFTWVQQCVKRRSISSLGSRSVSNYYRGPWRLYVYSSETRSWRLSVSIPITDHQFCQLFRIFDLKAVLWNGVLHWTTSAPITDDAAVCVCYDIEKETVWTMKYPKMDTRYTYTHRRLLYFGLCGERLLLIQESLYNDNPFKCFPTSFDVMEKQHNKDGDGEDMWSVRYHVDFKYNVNVDFKEVVFDSYLRLAKVITSSISILDIYRTMRRNKKGEDEEEEMLLIKVGSNKMISFSLTNNTFGLIKELLPNTFGLIEVLQPNREIKDLLCYTNIVRYTITLYPP